ncbi:MAG: 30S ribosomal protein S8 [Dehalococcoidia bacterium]|nr:30S ribosomal protein S8 [Dehalococcoidia bacterium]
MMTDPIADMLARIRNAVMARHDYVDVPASRIKLEMVRILKREGFIKGYEVREEGPKKTIRIHLAYTENGEPLITGLQRVSKPGLRVYVKRGQIPRVYGGLGIAILSTSQGVMTGQEAWRRRLGGEVLCYVW